jgi:hypothetical protein
MKYIAYYNKNQWPVIGVPGGKVMLGPESRLGIVSDLPGNKNIFQHASIMWLEENVPVFPPENNALGYNSEEEAFQAGKAHLESLGYPTDYIQRH